MLIRSVLLLLVLPTLTRSVLFFAPGFDRYIIDHPMANMSTLNVPELVDIIIDYLHDDRRSLASCALVAHQWVPSSRHHLFASVTLPSTRWLRFLELLDSSFTTISPHVRALTLTDDQENLEPLTQSIAHLATHLLAITSLSLEMMDWRTLSRDCTATLSSFHQITYLHLSCVRFITGDDVVDLIHSYPLLEEFSVEKVLCDSSTRGAGLPSSLRVLRIHLSVSLSAFMSVSVFSGHGPYALNTVDVSIEHYDLTSFRLFLRVLGSQLRHLILSINRGCSPGAQLLFLSIKFKTCLRFLSLFLDNLCSNIDLSPNTHLESIVFKFYHQPTEGFDFLPQVISRINSPFIESLDLNVSFASIDRTGQLAGFSHLDQVLTGSRFATLRRFLFRLSGSSFERTEYSEDVRQRMPMCDERGILVLMVL